MPQLAACRSASGKGLAMINSSHPDARRANGTPI
jgi:hypothetical protein